MVVFGKWSNFGELAFLPLTVLKKIRYGYGIRFNVQYLASVFTVSYSRLLV